MKEREKKHDDLNEGAKKTRKKYRKHANKKCKKIKRFTGRD
jgi:hypothetical protein